MISFCSGNYYIRQWSEHSFEVRKCTSSCYEYQWGDSHHFKTKEEAEAFVKEKCPTLKYVWDTTSKDAFGSGGMLFTKDAPSEWDMILSPYVDTTLYTDIGGREEVADYSVLNANS